MKLFDVYPVFDIEPVKAQGCWLWDKEGNKYLDLYGGHAVISIGHTHPHYVERISSQLQSLGFYSNSIINSLQVELAQKLGALSGYEEFALFLVNSGAEANENALKLASFHNGRKKIIAFKKGFHGRTSAAVRVTDNPNIIAPINEGFEVEYLPLNDYEAAEKAIAKGTACAVIIEGIQGIGGIHIPEPEFLKKLQQWCNQTNTVLILDEIQSGYGRSGKFFAHQYAEIEPDLITMAKGMGNGFPIGGVLINPKFEARYGLLGTTFGGNHLACSAALAVLEVLEQENLMTHAKEMGDYLMEALKGFPCQVRGEGLMIGLEFEQPIKEIRKNLLLNHNIFTGVSGTNVIRLLPPLTVTKEQLDQFVQALGEEIG